MKKKPLKPKTPLKKIPPKRKHRDPQSWTAKRNLADEWFSRYVRLRDSWYEDGAWVGKCISSGKKIMVMDANGKWVRGANIGHFIGRANYFLRYDEFNCNLQSAYDNAWRDKEAVLSGYRKALDFKYGKGTYQRLKYQAKANPSYRTKIAEFDEIIADSKTYIEHCFKYPENYGV